MANPNNSFGGLGARAPTACLAGGEVGFDHAAGLDEQACRIDVAICLDEHQPQSFAKRTPEVVEVAIVETVELRGSETLHRLRVELLEDCVAGVGGIPSGGVADLAGLSDLYAVVAPHLVYQHVGRLTQVYGHRVAVADHRPDITRQRLRQQRMHTPEQGDDTDTAQHLRTRRQGVADEVRVLCPAQEWTRVAVGGGRIPARIGDRTDEQRQEHRARPVLDQKRTRSRMFVACLEPDVSRQVIEVVDRALEEG